MIAPDVEDTIVAIASAVGSGLRGVIRLSGPATIACLSQCFFPRDHRQLDSHCFAVSIDGDLRLGGDMTLPVVVLLWPNQRSYTRQPSAEIHMIGSPPLLSLAVATLCAHGARLAQPGEFTMRAFLSGRIDLTQAEAVLAVIDATNQDRLSRALRQLAGGLAHPIAELRLRLLNLLADLEAGLDFVTEDIVFISKPQILSQLGEAKAALDSVLAQVSRRNIHDSAVRAVLAGRPNAGKSSLFNLLASGNAIVSDQPGTTRDFLVAHVIQGNLEVQLIDSAGLEQRFVDQNDPTNGIDRTERTDAADVADVTDPADVSNRSIDAQAVAQSRSQLEEADVVLFCHPADVALDEFEKCLMQHFQEKTILVLTKCDLAIVPAHWPLPPIATSSTRAIGLDRLKSAIFEKSGHLVKSWSLDASEAAQRTVESLIEARDSIVRALALDLSIGDEFIALEVRAALECLGRIVGAIYTDDILDRVFRRFCIGK